MLNKKVICLETNEIFTSGREAAKAKEICKSVVSRSCRQAKPTKEGLNFRFLDANGNIINTPLDKAWKCKPTKESKNTVVIHNESTVDAKGEYGNGNAKAVWCITTNEVFASGKDAALAHGVCRSEISRCCNDIRKNIKGNHYIFVSKTSENIRTLIEYINELQAKVNEECDPEYLAWKAEKEKAARKAELEQAISTCKANICELEVKTAHEYELFEAYIGELEKLNV